VNKVKKQEKTQGVRTTFSPMFSARTSTFIPFLAILGSVTFLGIGTSWAKHSLFPLVGAQGTTAVRVGLSALLMLLVVRPWRRWPNRRDLAVIACYGAALGAMNLLFYMSLQTLPLGVAVAIEFSGPLAVAIYSSRRPVDFIWVLLAMVGLYLLLPIGFGSGVDIAALDPVGVTYVLLAAICWATYIVFGKRVAHVPAGQSVSLGLAVAALVVMPVGVAHAGTALLSFTVLGVGLGVAILSSAIPISLEMVALQRLPRHAFGIMISMEPAVSALLALGLLDERLSSPQWLAIGLIVGASMGSAFTAQQTTTRKKGGIQLATVASTD
jgi:inner membrane transporter RhtA